MKTTIFIAAMLAVTTVIAAGLTVLPSSVQDAQANPCANEVTESGRGGVDIASPVPQVGAQNSFNPQDDDDRECDFTGGLEFEEDGSSDNGLAATDTATDTD